MNLFKHVMSSVMIAGLAMVGCVQLTLADDSICDSKPLSFAIPQGLPTLTGACQNLPPANVPSVSTTTTVDLSGPVKKVSDVASNFSVVVNQLVIDNSQGDLSWISGVDVQISGNNLPMAQLANYTTPDAGSDSQMNVNVVMPANTIVQYLRSGPVTLTITLMGGNVDACTVAKMEGMSSLSSSVDLCVAVSGDINKSL